MVTDSNSPKSIVIDLVNEKPGIKATELVAEFVNTWHLSGNTRREVPEDIGDILAEMVENGDIIEVEYILPTMSYRAKSLYFPKGTEVKTISKEK